MGDTDFYKQGDGSWKFYVSGGNGQQQGTFYDTDSSKTCLDLPFMISLFVTLISVIHKITIQ
jgi:hypothetical protein